MNQPMIKSVEFRKKRDKSWQRLDYLLQKVKERGGFKQLQPQELEQLASLYRLTASSLQVVRSISLDESLHQYLQSLVTRGFFVVYGTAPRQTNPVGTFFVQQFPELVRKYFLYHLVAFTVLALGIVAGFWTTLVHPSYYFSFVDPAYAQGRTPFSTRQKLEKSLQGGRDTNQAQRAYFFSYLFTHNTKVGFLTFTLGVALGLPTLFLLLTNGGLLGAMAAAFHLHGLSGPFWAWILPHGITEFLAVILCAGSGFIIALGILRPGKYGRLSNLKIAAQDAGMTVMGCVALFLVAGIIEAFFRQTALPDSIRYLFAMATALFWLLYLGGLPASFRR